MAHGWLRSSSLELSSMKYWWTYYWYPEIPWYPTWYFIVNKNLLVGINSLFYSLADKLPLLKGDLYFVPLNRLIFIFFTSDWKVVFCCTRFHSFYTFHLDLCSDWQIAVYYMVGYSYFVIWSPNKAGALREFSLADIQRD